MNVDPVEWHETVVLMSLSGESDPLCTANFREGMLLTRVLRRLYYFPGRVTRHSVFSLRYVAACVVDDGHRRDGEAYDIPHGFEAKEAGGQAQPSGTGVMQDIAACSADTKSGTEWGQALRRCLGFPASLVPYCTGQGSEMPWSSASVNNPNKARVGVGSRYWVPLYPEPVSTPCAILSGRSFFRLNYRTSFERAQLIRSRKRHPPF